MGKYSITQKNKIVAHRIRQWSLNSRGYNGIVLNSVR